MKKLIVILVLFASTALAEPPGSANFIKKALQSVQCPKTTMQTSCLECHIKGDFRVIETAADAHLVYPTSSMQVIDGEGHFLLTRIDDTGVKNFFDYLHRHSIKKAIIEVHSPGGALFDAQRIVGLIRYWQSRGVTVETRLYGAAFSAGFYIMVAGDKRLVEQYAELMWHEVQISSWGFNVTTPSDSEEKVKIYRHIQDVGSKYLATRGKLTKEEIDAKIARKEWWMSGEDALEYGFADGYIGK